MREIKDFTHPTSYTSGRIRKSFCKNDRLFDVIYYLRPTPKNDTPVVGNGWKSVKALSFQAVGSLR